MTRTLRSIGLGALGAVALLGAPSAHAQWGGRNDQQNSQLLFEWQGDVDRETQFTIGSRGVDVRGVQSNESRGRFVTRGSLPRGSGTLYVQRVSGRGDVDVVQQPGSNGGDGVVRVLDRSGGAGFYDIRVYWQPSGTYSTNGGSGGNGGYGYPGRGNGRDGGYDRGRDGREERDGDDDRGRDGVYERNGEVGRGRNRNGVALDRNGNVVRDRRGEVVYEQRGNKVVARDRDGNVLFDRNGKAIYVKADDRYSRRGR